MVDGVRHRISELGNLPPRGFSNNIRITGEEFYSPTASLAASNTQTVFESKFLVVPRGSAFLGLHVDFPKASGGSVDLTLTARVRNSRSKAPAAGYSIGTFGDGANVITGEGSDAEDFGSLRSFAIAGALVNKDIQGPTLTEEQVAELNGADGQGDLEIYFSLLIASAAFSGLDTLSDLELASASVDKIPLFSAWIEYINL